MKTNDIKKLSEEEFQKLRNFVNKDHWRREDKIKAPQARALVGKFFRSKNNYSCPEKDSDYWWEYYRVLKSTGSYLTVVNFAVDSQKNFKLQSQTLPYTFLDRREEISRKAYNRELKTFIAKAWRAAK